MTVPLAEPHQQSPQRLLRAGNDDLHTQQQQQQHSSDTVDWHKAYYAHSLNRKCCGQPMKTRCNRRRQMS